MRAVSATLAIGLLLVIAVPTRSAARCRASYGRMFQLLAESAPAGSGLLLGVGPRGSARGAELPSFITFRALDCRGTGCPRRVPVEPIAENLYRAALPTSLPPGEYRVNELGADSRIRIARGTPRPPVTEAPRVRRVERVATRRGRYVAVELDPAPPVSVVGLLARWNGRALFFHREQSTARFVFGEGRCWADGPQAPELAPGDEVEVAFVDGAGALSPSTTFVQPGTAGQ